MNTLWTAIDRSGHLSNLHILRSSHVEKFLAPGRGGDFCKLSFCHKPKSTVISVLVLRKMKLELLFCIFISYYLLCNKLVGFWDLALFTFPRRHQTTNKVTKVLFLTRNLCKAAVKIMAASASPGGKCRARVPGYGAHSLGVWKTWLWTKLRQRHANLPKMAMSKGLKLRRGHKEPPNRASFMSNICR